MWESIRFRSWVLFAVCVLCFLSFGYVSCRNQPANNSVGPSFKSSDDDKIAFASGGPCSTSATLDNATDITLWITDLCSGATLDIEEGTYNFGDPHFFRSNPKANDFILNGNDSKFVYNVTSFEGGEDDHAVFWATESYLDDPSKVKDLTFEFTYIPNGAYAVEFELCNVVIDNVRLKSAFTSRMHGIRSLYANELTLDSDHCLFFPGYPDGCLIKNSDLFGTVLIEIDGDWDPGSPSATSFMAASGNTFTFRNNGINDLELYSDNANVIKLTNNSLDGYPGTTVEIDGSFTVDADSNITLQGKCKSDAEDDFDVGAGSTLNLNSWVYADTTWAFDVSELESCREENTVTVTWETDGLSTSKVVWDYVNPPTANEATGAVASSHVVEFDVSGQEEVVYFKAISWIPGCSASENDSETGSNDAIIISDIEAEFDPQDCTLTVEWDTDVSATSKVYYGASCAALNYTSTSSGATTHHVVECDVTGVGDRRIYFKVESKADCNTARSDCTFISRTQCMQGP